MHTAITVSRNELAAAHEQAEQLTKLALGLSVSLDMRSRRPLVDLEPYALVVLRGDLREIDEALAALRSALAPYLVESEEAG